MNGKNEQNIAPEIRSFVFAMFDVLGFSRWVETQQLSSIISAYQQLITDAVIKPIKGTGLTAVQTPEGMLLAVTIPPEVAYFSDTILLWCPLSPPLVAIFVESCQNLICEALAMNIPLRGAITLGDAVLDKKTSTYIGKPIVEAAMLEKGQEWVGLTLGNSAMWPPFLTQLSGSSVIEYAAPMKKGYEQYAAPIVVDWPRKWRDKNTNDLCIKLDELNNTPAYSKYWENAKMFAEYSLLKHDWFRHPDQIPSDAVLRLVRRSEAKFE